MMTSISAITERPYCRGRVSFSQKWKTGTGRIYFCGHYRSISNHYDVIGQQSYRIRWKTHNAVHGHSRSSRTVSIESPHATSYSWLIQTDILSRTVSELSHLQPIVQILDTLRFWALLRGLGTTYDVHLRLIRKRAVDFLLVLIKLFG